MKIAFSCSGNDLDAMLDPRFGRAANFLIVDEDTLAYKVISNAAISASGGAGIAAAQSILDEGVETLITGNCGPNAFQVLNTAGVKIFTGQSGQIKGLIEDYKKGVFTDSIKEATVQSHSGMGKGL